MMNNANLRENFKAIELENKSRYIINIELAFHNKRATQFSKFLEWDFDDDIEKFAFDKMPKPFLGIKRVFLRVRS